MGRKKKDATGEAPADGEETKKTLRIGKIPLAVLVVALLGAGYLFGPGKSASSSADAAAATTTTTAEPGPVVVLEPITLNVPNGHYLKVGMALQMSFDYGVESAATASEDPKVDHAAALDAAIDVFGGSSYESLVTPDGRDAAKAKLLEALAKPYGGDLEGVYFTEFVLQ